MLTKNKYIEISNTLQTEEIIAIVNVMLMLTHVLSTKSHLIRMVPLGHPAGIWQSARVQATPRLVALVLRSGRYTTLLLRPGYDQDTNA